MFGRKIKYEMVKFSQDYNYRVMMLRRKDEYIVFVSDVRDNNIALGGAVNMTKDEAECEYNKQCVILGIAKKASEI